MLYQNLNDEEPGKDVTIVAANSSGLKDSQLGYSPVDYEVLALKFATDACCYFLYGAPSVNIFSDCSALGGLFTKPFGDIKNKRIRAIVEKIMCFNLKFHHVAGTINAIADCLSRLTRKIR